MSNATRWAIAGTGRISGLFADCITRTGSGTVAHVLSRTREGAEAFAGGLAEFAEAFQFSSPFLQTRSTT